MKDEDFIRNMKDESVFTVGLHNIVSSKKTDYEYQLEICTGNGVFCRESVPDVVDKNFYLQNSFLITRFCILE